MSGLCLYISWVCLVSLSAGYGGRGGEGAKPQLAEFGMAFSCQEPLPLFIVNLPRFPSLTQARQSSSSCPGLQSSSLDLAGTVPSCPIPHTWVCLRAHKPAPLELLRSGRGSHRADTFLPDPVLLVLGFLFFFFAFILLEDLPWTEQLQ